VHSAVGLPTGGDSSAIADALRLGSDTVACSVDVDQQAGLAIPISTASRSVPEKARYRRYLSLDAEIRLEFVPLRLQSCPVQRSI
jgi:hypothetical protein